MSPSVEVAVAVVAALRTGGVTDAVLSPGSRSAPLALALHRADALGWIRLHVRLDERAAGFLAVGLAKGSHRPVAVVTTSGTAVANLHPAVLEANHAGVPVVVLSADRPAALRGTGANQTTYQAGIFGADVAYDDVPPGSADAAVAAVRAALARHGPAQVNLQFAPPLVPDRWPLDLGDVAAPPAAQSGHWAAGEPAGEPAGGAPGEPELLSPEPPTVLVAGDDAGPPARLLAQRADWPLLAEPTSGARTGTHALRTYRLLLETALADRIERVVVAGHPTLSRPVTALISRPDLEVISVRGRGGYWTDPGRVARHLDVLPEVAGPGSAAWMASWRAADVRLGRAVDELVSADPELAPYQVAAAIAGAVPPGGLLVVGSSQPVRDLDVMAPPYPARERRLVIGNRGLAGIDGTVSTAVGAALGRPSLPALAYVGDLTFLHDATALFVGPREPRPALTIVVANDDGGAIFESLEPGEPRFGPAFERVFGTPHSVDIEALCAASHTPYQQAAAADLPKVLAERAAGIRVVEVPLSRNARSQTEHCLRDLAEQVAAAAG
ncbi:MAG TPA: 2-succinyl-5-enolpyruvyl-6-hydroxy-3-cyclohexene-1-carboxylic-acid synthase [Nocardioidaceae bacterium]|nr:2-succinyl-5-enolpyruvyl-6-hydroxy-3-cyclohexene-1-carboxylic-acid synthase [Nocardioidaceae bacterium]